MRGASRAALAAAKDRLAEAAVSGGDAAQLGDGLFAVADLLDREPALRRALADPASARAARTGLMTAVLGGNVSDATAQAAGAVAAGTWSAGSDLPDAFEQLGVLAIVAGADQAGQLDDLEDELFRFGRVVAGSAPLRTALGNPFAPAGPKRELIGNLLDGRALPQTITLVTQAALHPRGRSLDRSLEIYARLAAEQRERLIAEVRVAAELSAEQRDRLAAVLARRYGHEVHLNLVVDPRLIGGMIIRIRGEQIDASVASRLAQARRGLVA